MDRTVKILLGIVAASLVMLNMQLAGVSFVKEAHAETTSMNLNDFRMISLGFTEVASAIEGIDCK